MIDTMLLTIITMICIADFYKSHIEKKDSGQK